MKPLSWWPNLIFAGFLVTGTFFAWHASQDAIRQNCMRAADGRSALRHFVYQYATPLAIQPGADPILVTQVEDRNRVLAVQRDAFLRDYPLIVCEGGTPREVLPVTEPGVSTTTIPRRVPTPSTSPGAGRRVDGTWSCCCSAPRRSSVRSLGL